MKRGLVVLDPAEVSPDERVDRIGALQERLREEGVSWGLVYGDVHRSDDIAYLTNLCLYWNEGILAVPSVGEPAFLTKLSPRVHPWMRTSSTLTDLRSGKEFTALVRGLVEGAAPGVLGLLDGALWPADAVRDVRAAAPDRDVRLLGGLVREQRLRPSPAETVLLEEAAAHLRGALEAAAVAGVPDAERVAVVEGTLRGAGFTDVLAEVVHGPGGPSAVEASGQYRSGWVTAARLVDPATAEWAGAAQAALRAARAAVRPGVPAGVPAAAAARALTGLPAGAVARGICVQHADLSTGGDYASEAERVPLGSVAAIGVEVLFGDGGRVVVSEMVRVGAHGAEVLGAGGRKEESA